MDKYSGDWKLARRRASWVASREQLHRSSSPWRWGAHMRWPPTRHFPRQRGPPVRASV